MNILKNNQAE